MATLPLLDLARIARSLMRYWSKKRNQTTGITKADLDEAVSYTDNWIDSRAANLNAGLPQSIKDNLSQEQKTILFCAVASARSSIALLRSLLNTEVD